MNRVTAFAFDHRRPLAAACAALAVLAAVESAQPDDATVPMLVARQDLDSGHVVRSADLTTARVAAGARPAHVLRSEAAVGRRVSAPMRAGEPFTDRRVIAPRDLEGHGSGAALSMVRVADPGALAGLRVGDRVDVVATAPGEPARVVARSATLAIVPRDDDRDVVSVGVVTDADTSLDLAAAGLDRQLGIVVTK